MFNPNLGASKSNWSAGVESFGPHDEKELLHPNQRDYPTNPIQASVKTDYDVKAPFRPLKRHFSVPILFDCVK